MQYASVRVRVFSWRTKHVLAPVYFFRRGQMRAFALVAAGLFAEVAEAQDSGRSILPDGNVSPPAAKKVNIAERARSSRHAVDYTYTSASFSMVQRLRFFRVMYCSAACSITTIHKVAAIIAIVCSSCPCSYYCYYDVECLSRIRISNSVVYIFYFSELLTNN